MIPLRKKIEMRHPPLDEQLYWRLVNQMFGKICVTFAPVKFYRGMPKPVWRRKLRNQRQWAIIMRKRETVSHLRIASPN